MIQQFSFKLKWKKNIFKTSARSYQNNPKRTTHENDGRNVWNISSCTICEIKLNEHDTTNSIWKASNSSSSAQHEYEMERKLHFRLIKNDSTRSQQTKLYMFFFGGIEILPYFHHRHNFWKPHATMEWEKSSNREIKLFFFCELCVEFLIVVIISYCHCINKWGIIILHFGEVLEHAARIRISYEFGTTGDMSVRFQFEKWRIYIS